MKRLEPRLQEIGDFDYLQTVIKDANKAEPVQNKILESEIMASTSANEEIENLRRQLLHKDEQIKHLQTWNDELQAQNFSYYQKYDGQEKEIERLELEIAYLNSLDILPIAKARGF